jgi:UV DNA damage endonuclease
MKKATPERLREIICHNLCVLDQMIDYNIQHDIRLFRITSDLIPFGSSSVNTICWRQEYQNEMDNLGRKIKSHGIRISLHPGQYTIINSPSEEVVKRAVADLKYHNEVLDSLGADNTNKIILHIGGVYENKGQAMRRFITRYQELDERIRNRLVIENDDRSFTIGDVLEISAITKAPVVYDCLHNAVNPHDPDKDDLYWIHEAAMTWKASDGNPKIHYSQQDPRKPAGSHSDTIRIIPFLDFYERVKTEDVDIMLEVKDKNLSAVKCQNVIKNNLEAMPEEWEHYRHLVLQKSPFIFEYINRSLSGLSWVEFYDLMEEALAHDATVTGIVKALNGIWKDLEPYADIKEKKKYESYLEDNDYVSARNYLGKLAKAYREVSWKEDYFFHLT